MSVEPSKSETGAKKKNIAHNVVFTIVLISIFISLKQVCTALKFGAKNKIFKLIMQMCFFILLLQTYNKI